jgi:Ca2+/Na+ antiporter
MTCAWIGGISYVLVWMITVVGFTFGIPDSVMGLSFLGIGNSVPEVNDYKNAHIMSVYHGSLN